MCSFLPFNQDKLSPLQPYFLWVANTVKIVNSKEKIIILILLLSPEKTPIMLSNLAVLGKCQNIQIILLVGQP